MSKKLLWVLLLLSPLYLHAQQDSLTVSGEQVEQVKEEAQALPKPKFGYLSYSAVIHQMPEYIQAQEKLALLQKRYDEELARADKEFNLKFAEFLDGQKTFPENILLKRQKETLLEKARKDFGLPVEEKLNTIIADVAKQLQLEYVLNTDNNACPYINKEAGVDITTLVKSQFK